MGPYPVALHDLDVELALAPGTGNDADGEELRVDEVGEPGIQELSHFLFGAMPLCDRRIQALAAVNDCGHGATRR